jgi:hypothetical protein
METLDLLVKIGLTLIMTGVSVFLLAVLWSV